MNNTIKVGDTVLVHCDTSGSWKGPVLQITTKGAFVAHNRFLPQLSEWAPFSSLHITMTKEINQRKDG